MIYWTYAFSFVDIHAFAGIQVMNADIYHANILNLDVRLENCEQVVILYLLLSAAQKKQKSTTIKALNPFNSTCYGINDIAV